jgi:RNA polymerase sigma-70 factor (ECF subfamily)
VRSWTLGIVRNRAIDALRSRAGGRESVPLDDSIFERQPAAERTEAVAFQRETAGELRGALRELPIDQSKVIELAYFGGFTQSEIATMMSLPLGTVKGRMRLGLEKIRGNLAGGLA